MVRLTCKGCGKEYWPNQVWLHDGHQGSEVESSVVQNPKTYDPDPESGVGAPFDRVRYQREYMRRRRAKRKA